MSIPTQRVIVCHLFHNSCNHALKKRLHLQPQLRRSDRTCTLVPKRRGYKTQFDFACMICFFNLQLPTSSLLTCNLRTCEPATCAGCCTCNLAPKRRLHLKPRYREAIAAPERRVHLQPRQITEQKFEPQFRALSVRMLEKVEIHRGCAVRTRV